MRKITLICGSLEPKKDGVGDYSQTLAKALRNRGTFVTLLAICDKYVNNEIYSGTEMLRLPAAWPAQKRYQRAAEAIANWTPEWISLQFVSWDFGWKGIVIGQAKMLYRLTRGRLLHVMFHETWVGGAPEIPRSVWAIPRRTILGVLQKASIKSISRRLSPQLVHVSNFSYQQNLDDIGVIASQMPMFSSVEVLPRQTWEQVRPVLVEATKVQFPANRSDVILVGMFGAVRPCPVEDALRAILAAAPGNKRVILIAFGSIGRFGDGILRSWRQKVSGFEIVTTGPLVSERLSACFHELDFAISLHPARVIGRSSAAAALLEHGVPIICPWGEVPASDDKFVLRSADLLYSVSRTEEVLFNPPKRVLQGGWAKEAGDQLLAEMDGVGTSARQMLS